MEGSPGALWSPRRITAAALAAAAAASAVVGHLIGANTGPVKLVTLGAAVAVGFTAMAALVLAGVPGHPVGRLMAAAGLTALAGVVAASWSRWIALDWLSQWLWLPPLGLILLSLLVFPDGRLPSRRWAPVAVFVGVVTAAATVALAVAALDHPRDLFPDAGAAARTDQAQALVVTARAAVLLGGLGAVLVLASLLLRWRAAHGETRQQLMCLFAAGLVVVLALLLDARNVPGAFLLAGIAVPVAMTIAVLRYRLYGLDRIINRTVVWLTMTVLVIVGFVAIVTLLRDVIAGGGTTETSLIATGLIAVTFEPVHRRVQRGVNQLLYGERDDPYKVIGRLGELLGYTLDPRDILPLLTETIVRSLRVPYAAVELQERDGTRVLAEHGELTTGTQAFDMVTHGQRVGRLLVATRTVGGRFSAGERRLLEGAAVHAAVAAEAMRLVGDLEDSRNRLIVAQDKERARLWRDLHDGVAPALTGMAMQVRAARKCVRDPDRVTQLLDGLASDLRDCTSELRQLVDHLQPHALERGLAAALRTECRRFATGDLSIDLTVSDNLDGLPIATQAAAYRIVAEALHNVARHARANTCRVVVCRDKALTVDIVDDGVGLGAPRSDGVGLTSMRERAAELGGDCVVAAARPRGTAVRVRLPIAPMVAPSSEG